MHERISVNSLCFPGAKLGDLAGYWRSLGARRVSFITPLLLGENVGAAREALTSGSYQLETIAHGPLVAGPLTPDEASWREGQEAVNRMIRAAAELGGRSVYVLTGGHGTNTWEEAAKLFSTAVAPCLAAAKAAGVALAFETALPLYADFHIAHSLRDSVTLAEISGVGICVDLYHCWTEAGLKDSIKRAVPYCDLVQVSDYVYGDRSLPSRAVPGDGVIPLQRLIGWLLEAGYKGAFDFELLGPRIDKVGHYEAVRRAGDHVSKILQSLGA